MKRLISLILATVMVLCVFASCGTGASTDTSSVQSEVQSKEPAKKADVKLATLMGPTGMGMAYLLDDAKNGKALNNYEYEVYSGPEEVTTKLVSGQVDIAALPTNAAATLYNKSNGKIKLVALNTLGVLYLVTKGDSIKEVADLKGKTIYVSGQGATPEYALTYVLNENGLEVGKDVKLDFTYANHDDLVAFAASGKADVVLLPEPKVTALLTKNTELKVAFDLNDLWADAVKDTDNKDSIIAMGCVAVNTAFAEANPDAVANFLKEYKASVDKVNEDNAAAAEVIAGAGIVPAAPVALKALPRCNIVCITGDEMKAKINDFYNVLYTANPDSVGGKLPDDNFYYIG